MGMVANECYEGEIIKCRAAVSWEANDILDVQTIDVEPPQEGEVRIKVLYCGICHTDIHGMKDEIPNSLYPGIMGHEAAGIVESVGEGVESIKAGDKVIPVFSPQCNSCELCKDDKSNLCTRSNIGLHFLPDRTSRYRCNGQKLTVFLNVSGFSQYIVVSEDCCVKVPEDSCLDKLCLLGCGIPNGYGAAINIAKVTPGSTCAVWGLGTIGLAAAMGCKANGASRIIGIDINEDIKEWSKIFGVTDFVNPEEYEDPIEEVLLEKTGRGCDFTFECTGRHKSILGAFNACRNGGGKCVLLGACPPDLPVSINPNDFLFSKTITGCLYGGYRPKQCIPTLLKDYKDKKILLEEFITETLSLDQINIGIDLIARGKALRIVIDMFD